jgi:hypothetical protein
MVQKNVEGAGEGYVEPECLAGLRLFVFFPHL